MNIHEFQAKKILEKYGLPMPPFFVVSSKKEIEELIKQTGFNEAVLKVQVHAGGRGKAGGVQFAKTPGEILSKAEELLGKKIVTAQTGPQGVTAHQLLITKPIDIQHEYYVGITIDRSRAQAVLILSPSGGVEIEAVARQTPSQVLTMPIPDDGRLRPYHFLRIFKLMGWQGELAKQGKSIIQALLKAFKETDATLLEINPLVQTPQDQLVILDAKLTIDDNALFRQPELKKYFDPTQVPSQEARAHEIELAYVSLDGSIGCMVNGAGLAMATMDIIHYYGGQPANFLDVGGGASQEKVAEGFKIILSDPQVKAILVNIFGGIMNCETLAAGLIEAIQQIQLKVPLVVRMEGTNVERGRQLLKDSQLPIVVAQSLTEAAQKVVAMAKEAHGHPR